MQLESSFYINTRKRKVSVTFDDEFDYLYEIKDNAELCLDVKKVMRENTFLELDFGLKISASRVFWDSGFQLPGSLGYWVNFSFPGSLGYWILAFQVLLDIGFQLPEFFGILKKKIEQIEWIKWISVELSSQSGQTGDTRIEQIFIDPFG
ncbi:hypothetical protein GLOIN_2v1776594 [Rhizophagus irregularis DAOM 181602=DAOM 197198]|uniref:Uncharacterized protein n=1 Tax=Rhizophagus irregularis (strain DAOM 181602 / DAOM 197198 / MUCL 43194) TaxID=747089 RepID=A0A2P4PWN0_RHIID|nr:hypothetical protein GLOIN_2v1776594 [Rhizophagus irregularis DAOM 181602=DAOM 197198]POG69770.1 hypothetical protein GLOIN_2v1776594 [Rhizophagus irregularis DAOM 181602=DAOM 197198]|eukprot:XP_025176636.1 hypothetical protein GLOIN_2v1776594 [Rhizophagus irregularis DAOM 181602=DAOM 197198]